MSQYRHPNIVNFLDSYYINEELWVFLKIKGCDGVFGWRGINGRGSRNLSGGISNVRRL